MSAALALLRLQQVDTRMDQLDAELGQIHSQLRDEAAALTAREAVELVSAEQRRLEQARVSAEADGAALRSKLGRAESDLYGGKVRNPKELQDLQAEVASLKRQLLVADADEVAWMEKLEVADEAVTAAKARLTEVLETSESERSRLRDRESDLLGRREQLLTERAATAETVLPRWNRDYADLRKSRGGVAVAAIEEGACAACGTTLTPALQQSARHSATLVLCPSCGRILYSD